MLRGSPKGDWYVGQFRAGGVPRGRRGVWPDRGLRLDGRFGSNSHHLARVDLQAGGLGGAGGGRHGRDAVAQRLRRRQHRLPARDGRAGLPGHPGQAAAGTPVGLMSNLSPKAKAAGKRQSDCAKGATRQERAEWARKVPVC